MNNSDALRLDNQLCFSLYAASKEIIKMYKPFLDPFGLTYTQYIVLLVLWEEDHITVTNLGKKLLLDSGTLTPLLKKMETAGYLTRERSKEDERTVIVALTTAGVSLKSSFLVLPSRMFCSLGMPCEETVRLKGMLDTLLKGLVSEKK